MMAKCIADREVNDKITLKSMKESMDKIQKVILKNFGVGGGGGGGGKVESKK